MYLHDLSFDCPVKVGLINASLKNHTTLTNQRNGSKAKPPKKCVDGNQGKRTKQHRAKQRSHSNHDQLLSEHEILCFSTLVRYLHIPLRTVSGFFCSAELPDKQNSKSTATKDRQLKAEEQNYCTNTSQLPKVSKSDIKNKQIEIQINTHNLNKNKKEYVNGIFSAQVDFFLI